MLIDLILRDFGTDEFSWLGYSEEAVSSGVLTDGSHGG